MTSLAAGALVAPPPFDPAALAARCLDLLRAFARSRSMDAWAMSAADGRARDAAEGAAAADVRFERQVLPHLDGAYNLARFLARDAEAAEDIVQEACLRAFRSFEAFRGGSARAWLFAIVRNCHYDWRSERRRAVERAAPDLVTDDGDREAFDIDRLAAEIDTPEDSLARLSEAGMVRAVLGVLPETYREILVLRELEELSYREIAEAAAIPIGTVMSRLARARQLFQDVWRRHAETRGDRR